MEGAAGAKACSRHMTCVVNSEISVGGQGGGYRAREGCGEESGRW